MATDPRGGVVSRRIHSLHLLIPHQLDMCATDVARKVSISIVPDVSTNHRTNANPQQVTGYNNAQQTTTRLLTAAPGSSEPQVSLEAF